jgi:hypothetical protein
MYELNRQFQNSWATKLPWANVGVDGKVTHVKCKVCNVMEMRNKFWCPNWIICGNMLAKRRPKLHLWVW